MTSSGFRAVSVAGRDRRFQALLLSPVKPCMRDGRGLEIYDGACVAVVL